MIQMTEYLSREDILDIASQYCPDDDGSCSKADVDLREMLDEIEALPAADVQPVKHGEWRKKFLSDTICCSECKVTWSSSFKDMLNGFNYCPNCSARMDGDTNG